MKTLLNYLNPVKGYFIPEIQKPFTPKKLDRIYETRFRNKGYRNLAYWLNCYIINSGQALIDVSGVSETVNPTHVGTATFTATGKFNVPPVYLNFGSSSNPHDVSRYELYSRHFSTGALGLWWLEELDTETRIQTYHSYAFPSPSRSVGEIGLYFRYPRDSGRYWFMIARVIVDPPINKEYNTVYTEGWRITFPSNYTRWLLRALLKSTGDQTANFGYPITATDGLTYLVRDVQPFAGSTDVRIGRDNTAPSPTHYNLLNPIGSLGSQSHSVEIDTTLQECRIVRIGTYTPSVNETLGEVGLFCNVYDVGGTARTIMIARGIWDPPVTLVSGTTYTIGIVLRMG
jgi:hypothetical protein